MRLVAGVFASRRDAPYLSVMLSRFLFLTGLLLFTLSLAVAQPEPARTATLLNLDGAVTPTVATYIEDGIEAANADGDEFVLLEIDTPGGLVTAMEDIVKAMKASDVPVVTYVAPEGARALSAGFYILYGSDVAAMAPSTTTGAATPVSLGGDAPAPASEEGEDAEPDLSSEASMRRKVIESSVAYVRGLAVESGRNVEFAEAAVRDGDSITAREALEAGVIEIVARDRDALLAQLDGREVTTRAGPVTIQTEGLTFERVEMTTLQAILHFLADPNVAAILMTLGTTGLIVELWNPGSIFPGALGAMCLALGLYSFSVLPFEGLYAALMVVGVVLITVEAFTPTFGLAGLAGLGMVGAGLYYVFPADLRIGWGVLIGILIGMGAFLGAVLWALVRSRGHGPLTGGEALLRAEGQVIEWQGAEGWVLVHGERWRARAKAPLSPGERVRVVAKEGLVLTVRRVGKGALPAGAPHADPSPTQATNTVAAPTSNARPRRWDFRR